MMTTQNHQILHTTSEGNQILIHATWQFDMDGRWILHAFGTVDGMRCEYRGQSVEKDGKKYAAIHVPGVGSFGIPEEKWVLPSCPMSEPWREFLDFTRKSYTDMPVVDGRDSKEELQKSYYREKDRLVRAIMESDTIEGRTAVQAVLNIQSPPIFRKPSITMQLAMSSSWEPMNILVNWMLSKEMAEIRGVVIDFHDPSTPRRGLVI